MRYCRKLLPSVLIFSMLLTGCGTASAAGGTTSAPVQSAASEDTDTQKLFTKRDLSGSFSDNVYNISLSGASAASGCDTVRLGTSSVTVTAEGTYILSGEFEGTIIVDAAKSDKVQLVLSGADIHSSGSAAIYIAQADKVFVTLAENTANTLSCTAPDSDSEDSGIDAAIYAKDKLTINGSGSVEISSQNLHGIFCKDTLRITGGKIGISAAKRGLSSKEDIRICNADISIKCEKMGIRAKSDDEALGNIFIESGRINVSSADDCIHASGNIDISGGSITLESKDDAVHADAAVTISGGSLSIKNSYEGIEGQCIYILGGEIDLTSSDDGLNAAGGNDASGFMGPVGNRDSFSGKRPDRAEPGRDFRPADMPESGKGLNPFDRDSAPEQRSGMMPDAEGFGGGFGGFGADDSCSIEISGGTLVINSEGDGIDSNGSLCVSGGAVYVSGPTNSGNGALDFGTGAAISGGTVIAAGAMGMAENFGSESTQCSVLFSTGSQPGGTELTLKDSSGKTLLSFSPEKKYECVVISSPDIRLGESYTLTAGSSTVEVTVESIITGESRGMFSGKRPGPRN